MGRIFPEVRSAKEYLAERIVSAAERHGQVLSRVERGMLYFSDSGWAPGDARAVAEDFDQTCDPGEYEAKVARIVAIARQDAKCAGEIDDWREAVRILKTEDHYLLWLLEMSGERPKHVFLKLIGTALLISILLAAGIWVWVTRLR